MTIGIQLMSVDGCCERGDISRATFYRLAKNDPKFPALIKMGGCTRVRADHWDDYVEYRTRNGGKP